ncbi:MAG: hypothetical protein IT380_14230 [Myxococcales bacterium]|nr:hypothetical protein [Myxococcales bacterium]
MRTSLLLLASLSVPALADEYVAPPPRSSELSRFAVLKAADGTYKLDTMTGATWFACAKKGKAAWCRAREIAGLPSGPAGRYHLVDASPVMLLDTVSGRTWTRCELPTVEKGLGFCPVEE